MGGVNIPLGSSDEGSNLMYQKYAENVTYDDHVEETCRFNPTVYEHPMDCRDDEVTLPNTDAN